VGLCSKVEVNHVHSVNRWSNVDGECFCVVTGGCLWVNNSLVLTCVRWSLHLTWGSPGTRCAVYGGTCVFFAVGQWLCGIGWCSKDPHCVVFCGSD
jgi:hypothetical protein